jgi:hypothetical protein
MADTTKEEFLLKKEELIQLQKEAQQFKAAVVNKVVSHTPQQVINNVSEIVNNVTANRISSEQNTKSTQSKPLTVQTQSNPVAFSNDPLSNVARAINDAILPAKSQLSGSDPFHFMISKDYLASFVFVALLVVNLMNIMN